MPHDIADATSLSTKATKALETLSTRATKADAIRGGAGRPDPAPLDALNMFQCCAAPARPRAAVWVRLPALRQPAPLPSGHRSGTIGP